MNLLKNKITKYITAIILIAGLLSPVIPIYAQETFKTVLEEITEKMEQIEGIKNNTTLTAEEKAIEETTIRKEILSKIFELTLLENQDLKTKLADVKNLTEKEGGLRDNLLKMLKENELVYQLMQERLEKAQTLNEIKQLAADFKDWRALVYNPKVEKIVAFILVFQEERILEIARERLQKIAGSLEKLETTNILKKEDTAQLIQKAVKNLDEAEVLNDRAKKIIVYLLNNELSQQIKWGIGDSLIYSQDSFITTATVKINVNNSLEYIRSAYKLFIEIGNLVKQKLNK